MEKITEYDFSLDAVKSCEATSNHISFTTQRGDIVKINYETFKMMESTIKD